MYFIHEKLFDDDVVALSIWKICEVHSFLAQRPKIKLGYAVRRNFFSASDHAGKNKFLINRKPEH